MFMLSLLITLSYASQNYKYSNQRYQNRENPPTNKKSDSNTSKDHSNSVYLFGHNSDDYFKKPRNLDNDRKSFEAFNSRNKKQ